MIKKLIILFLFIILISLSLIFFKESNKYKLPKQYKIEIEKIINEETPKTKKCIDENFIHAKNEYLKIKDAKDSENIEKSVFLIEDYQRGIEVCEFNMASMLIEKTESYTNIKDKIPPTDFVGTLYEVIYPYFHKNNINYQEIDNISNYSNSKINEIENFSYIKLNKSNIYNYNN